MPTQPVATTLVLLSQIHPNPDQPRKQFDPDDLAALKASIQERGLINPISVIKRSENDYMIMAGERRFRAVQELGWEQIDARIWPTTTSPQEVELLSLVENLQRQDLRPLEIANGYKLLTEDPYKLTQEEIAKQIGKPRSTLADYLSLANLPQEVQKIVDRSTNLGLRHLLQLLRLKTPQDQIALAQQADQKGLTVKELKTRVDKAVNSEKLKTKSSSPLADQSSLPSAPSDPCAGVWAELRQTEVFGSDFTWDIKFGVQPGSGRFPIYGWNLYIAPMDNPSKDNLVAWLQKALRALGGLKEQSPKLPDAAAPAPKAAPAQPKQDLAPIAKKEPLEPELAAMIARRKAQRTLP